MSDFDEWWEREGPRSANPIVVDLVRRAFSAGAASRAGGAGTLDGVRDALEALKRVAAKPMKSWDAGACVDATTVEELADEGLEALARAASPVKGTGGENEAEKLRADLFEARLMANILAKPGPVPYPGVVAPPAHADPAPAQQKQGQGVETAYLASWGGVEPLNLPNGCPKCGGKLEHGYNCPGPDAPKCPTCGDRTTRRTEP